MRLGRPPGAVKKLRLDPLAGKIDEYLRLGIDKRAIAKLVDVSPGTLYARLKVRRPAPADEQGLSKIDRAGST